MYLSFAHSHVVTNPYDFLCSIEHTKNVLGRTVGSLQGLLNKNVTHFCGIYSQLQFALTESFN